MNRHPYTPDKVQSRAEAFAGFLLACAIGIGLGLTLAFNL